MWRISATGNAYAGGHAWFTSADCSERGEGSATWRVREVDDRFLLVFCTAAPGAGEASDANPATRCSTLERAKPGSFPDEGTPGLPADRPTPPQVCSGPACLVLSPRPRGEGGCLPRGRFTHRFTLRLRKASRRLRVRAVRFTLDWKPNGSDRRSPFVARVDGRRLAAGNHLLLADVRLRAPGSKRTATRRLSYRFRSCA
jgi:hypothetical protein